MDIHRNVDQGGLAEARRRVKFCLDMLEKEGFRRGVDWNTTVTERLTLEEIIGALVASEQVLDGE